MKNLTLVLIISTLISCNQIIQEKVNDRSKNNTDTIIVKETVKSIDYNIQEQSRNEKMNDLNTNLKSFIPKDYTLLSIEYGDLNLDKYKDAILILRKNNEEKTSNMRDEGKPEKRPLLILSGQKDSSYKLVFKNDNAILCFDCIGIYDNNNPFSKITIKNGRFTIVNSVTGSRHWNQTITFKYNTAKNNWYLYETNYVSYQPNSKKNKNSKKLVVNYTSLKTEKDFGDIPFQEFNIYNEEENTTTPQTITETKDINKKLISFVPKNYSILSIQYGDLNLDQYPDAIIVLSKDDEEKTSNTDEGKPEKRPLLILLGQRDGSYKLTCKNHNVIESIDSAGSFGDPFMGITIKNGYFYIGHGIAGGHHWEGTITFKYNKPKNNWFLYKIHYTNYVLNDSEDDNNTAFLADYDNYKTTKDFGEISFQKFNIYNKIGY